MYTGYRKLELSDTEIAALYEKRQLPQNDFQENEYIYLAPADEQTTAGDYFQYRNGDIRRLKFPTIESTFAGRYKPRNVEQVFAFDMLKDEEQLSLLHYKMLNLDYLLLQQNMEMVN